MKKKLYLGIDPPPDSSYDHYPILKITFDPLDRGLIAEMQHFTHIIFTSKNGVRALKDVPFQKKQIIAVGTKTAELAREMGATDIITAEEETAEGVIALLDTLTFEDPYFFWPHSSLSRRIIPNYLTKKEYDWVEEEVYRTTANDEIPLLDLSSYDEIFFTSPSTVDAFIHLYGNLPTEKKLQPIGPITAKHLKTFLALSAHEVIRLD